MAYADAPFYQQMISCACMAPEHAVIVWEDDGDEDFPLVIHVQLDPRLSFLRRLWAGLKYIFKPAGRAYHWDCTLLSPSRVLQLKEIVDKAAKRHAPPDDKTAIYAE